MLPRFGENLFDESIVELIWKCQQGKHEEMVRTVYNLIQEVLPYLTLPIIDSFFEKIKSMPPAQIDEKYIVFMREFSKEAFKRRYEQAQLVFAEDLKTQVTDHLQQKFLLALYVEESQAIAQLTATNAGELANKLEPKTHDYGLRLFWQICQDSEH